MDNLTQEGRFSLERIKKQELSLTNPKRIIEKKTQKRLKNIISHVKK